MNREYRLCSDALRVEYLRRAGMIAPGSTWRVLAYVLMSSHVHWVLVCSGHPIRRFIHPLHVGFAGWLNRQQRRIGPVFAQRPTTILAKSQDIRRVIAYVHNNPVRAGIVTSASESDWSSHRHYLRSHTAPDWLDVRLGLQLSGLDTSHAAVGVFDDYVTACAEHQRDPVLTGATSIESRTRIRQLTGIPVELESPTVDGERVSHRILVRPSATLVAKPRVQINEVIRLVVGHLGLPLRALHSKSRTHDVVKARRLILMICCIHLGYRIRDVAGALGIATSSASDLLHRRPERVMELGLLAEQIMGVCERKT